MRTFLIAILLVTLAACGSTVPADLKSGNKKIVVLSFMGNAYTAFENTQPSNESIQQQLDRMTASQNSMYAGDYGQYDLVAGSQMKRWRHEIVDWGIDRAAVAKVRSLLEAKYDVIAFEYNPETLQYEGDFEAFVYQFANDLEQNIRQQPGFAGSQSIDAYVILLPAKENFTIFDQRWSYGVGMARDFLAFAPGQQIGDGVYMLHALYNIAVLDGHSFEQLAVAVADHETLYHNRFRGNPAVFVDNSYWVDSYDKLTNEQRIKITARVYEMLDATLPGTLRKLNLLP